MIRAIALVSALALAGPAMAAGDAAQAEDPQPGQLSGYWNEVFPLPGESYGMFPEPFGNPHNLAAVDEDTAQDTAADAAGAAQDSQVAETSDDAIDPGIEGPDLRDATGERVD